MKRTDGKLAEARFFFEKIREYYHRSPDVGYYANAFIAAARSVTWVLKAECQKIPGWQKWYEAKNPTEEEGKILRKMNDARTRSQKKESIALQAIMTITPDKEDNSSSEIISDDKGGRIKTMTIPMVTTGPGEAYIPSDLTQTTKELEEFRGEDIVEVAARYLEMLTELVEECRARFFP
jgi:hypothetical protein